MSSAPLDTQTPRDLSGDTQTPAFPALEGRHFLPNTSLRLRLALTYTVLAVLSVLLVGFVITFFLKGAIDQQFEDRLKARADNIALNLNFPATRVGVSNPLNEEVGLYQFANTKGQVRGSSPQLSEIKTLLPIGSLNLKGVSFRAVERDYLIRGEKLGRIWIGLSVDNLLSIQKTALQYLLWGALLTGIITFLVGLLVGRRALMGISRAAFGASQIEPNSKELLETPVRRDELFKLVSAINALLTRIWDQKDFENRFIGQVAHELGAPLTSIQGFIQRAQTKNNASQNPSSEINHALEQAGKVSSELHFVAQDLMQLARGRSEITLALHLLGAHNLQERLERLVHGVEFSGNWNAYVLCDPDRLVQALRNLLANARRAASVDGWVGLELRSTPEFLLFIVRDSGPGLPPGAEKKIFEAFFSRSSSSGLGLSVATQIATLHGGSLTARNHPEGGAEFTLSLPQPFDEEDTDTEFDEEYSETALALEGKPAPHPLN